MTERRPNVLFLFSDEHDPRHMGISGSPLVKTPHLDTLARRGTRFPNAYTSCPICVPARASLATGLPVHELGKWDNALAYDGRVQGWCHTLAAAGHRVESIGKLHYRNGDDPTGFDVEHLAMHIWEGIGQVWGAVRDPLPSEHMMPRMLKEIGPGWSNYNQYDADVTAATESWLRDRAASPDSAPWALFVGLVAPHFPLVAPQEYFDLYPLERIEHSKLLPEDGYQQHPWIQRLVELVGQEHLFKDDPDLRKLAIAGYFALCSSMDANMGRILTALGETGLADDTLVIYTSDHGDNIGQRGLWGKSNLYREASAVPMIVAGPDVPVGDVNFTTVNLTDIHATILDAMDVSDVDDEFERPSRSLLSMLGGSDHERTTLSEYHAVGADTGAFMVADSRYKYHRYVDYPEELFDLRFDPEETTNLAGNPSYATIVERMRGQLTVHLGGRSAATVDRMAKDDQNELIERFGGREQALKSGTPGATPVPGKGHE